MPRDYDSGPTVETNSWTEYRRLVTQGIRDLDTDIKDSNEKFDKKFSDLTDSLNNFKLQMTIDITELKTKAGVWGGVVGAIVSVIIGIIIGLILRK